MGPLRERSGEASLTCCESYARPLQWGRCANAAESAQGNGDLVLVTNLLQWGRCANAAERADNGALLAASQAQLQWGRCANAAERPVGVARTAHAVPASMGPLRER